MGVRLIDSPNSGFLFYHNSKLSLLVEMKSKQHLDPLFMDLKESILINFNESSSRYGDCVLRYQGRLCMTDVENLRGKILEEAHGSVYSIHSSATKMYCDLHEV